MLASLLGERGSGLPETSGRSLPRNSRLGQKPTAAESYARQRFAVEPAALETLGTIDHAFTHFDLSITPLLLRDVAADDRVMEPSGVLWYNPQDGAMRIGLPAPAKQLLDDLLGQTFELSRNAPYG
jgi:adenine-specific DNA glycosylase